MKTIGIDGKIYQMDIRPSVYGMRTEQGCKSKFQYECGQIIKSQYPFDIILEEVNIPGINLKIDFFIPTRKIMFEIQGEQHGEFNKFFHKTKQAFRNSQDRDSLKKQWAEINNIKYIEVFSIDQLKDIING